MFIVYRLTIPENYDVRTLMGNATTFDMLFKATSDLKSRYEMYASGDLEWIPPMEPPEISKLPFPPYLCQPYVRPPKQYQTDSILEDASNSLVINVSNKRKLSLPESILLSLPAGTQLSNNKIKKMSKRPDKNWGKERLPVILCLSCVNPYGARCVYKLCRNCCKSKCCYENLNCKGHGRR